jgi:hypothetical protein
VNQAETESEPHAAVARHTVEPYWKDPAFWDVTLYLRSAEPARTLFERLLALAERGWTVGEAEDADEDRWAVWNPAPGVELLTPRVRWAELQVWRPAAESRPEA